MTIDEWLTTTQVGAELGRSRDWVVGQIKTGRLTAQVFTGGERNSYRIRRENLAAFEREYLTADRAS